MALPADALAGKTLMMAADYYSKRDGQIEIDADSHAIGTLKNTTSSCSVSINVIFCGSNDDLSCLLASRIWHSLGRAEAV